MVVDAAYAACLRLAHQHYENFPVASKLAPRAMRPHIAAIYAFARIADDFADEGSRSDTARLALLDDWRRRLHASVSGDRAEDDASDATAIFTALADTIRRCDLDVQLLDDLLTAFRQDVLVKRYDTWDDLLGYCRLSANPIGRLVLRVAGYRDAGLDARSDDVCTALQLTNFWQDLDRDWRIGRLYIPLAIVQSSGAQTSDLDRRVLTPAWRAALGVVAGKTRALFQSGRPVADGVRGRLRWELRATWAGGVRILDRLESRGFDVFAARPALGWHDGPVIAWKMLTWPRRSGAFTMRDMKDQDGRKS